MAIPKSSFHITPYSSLQFPFKFPSKPSKILCSQNPNQQSPPSTITLISILRIIPDWADAIKESRMKQPRPLYKHKDWVEHRSSLRHIRHLLSSLSSRVILSLVPPVIAFTAVAVVVASYNTAVFWDLLPEFFPVLRASSLPYQLTAPALALLLVFRTEASYSRFEEGRKAWTKVISGTNDFARQVIVSVETDSVLKMALLQYVLAFPIALKCHLIHGSDVGGDLKNLLEDEDLAAVLSSTHRPRCIIQFISQTLQLLNLESSKRTTLESKVTCFHEGIGVCEQITSIPIPLSYTRLTSRFLVLWHLTLPIILWDDCHWIVVPATFISAASLFCIEEVGVLIEEPFPMLALDELCKLVYDNVQEALMSEKKIREILDAKMEGPTSRKQSLNGYPISKSEQNIWPNN
ncbi:voltage-dependent chloride channel 1, chloroplastic-like [Rutidosis leptorrhynchoides]|uniref:voltage-dependent chloride channel 1, chloroplastic-like n=1 Tax=Rutidosis leptorrhynchoides TaxID=125765 RepID=UPI003A99C8FD